MRLGKIKKSDIKYNPDTRRFTFRGHPCKRIGSSCRDVYHCERYGIVLKIDFDVNDDWGDGQNLTEYESYKALKRKYKPLLKYFVECLAYFSYKKENSSSMEYDEYSFDVCVQRYVKLKKKKLNLLDEIFIKGMLEVLDIGDDIHPDSNWNISINAKTNKPVIYDLGMANIY